MSKTSTSIDGKIRCKWCNSAPEFLSYHDKEWGFPVSDDIKLFEKLCLESFQSGLSWRTILAKRDNFRSAFLQFDFNKIAQFTDQDVERLLQDKGIVRHRGKIEAVINNAKCAIQLVDTEGALGSYFWRYEVLPDEKFNPQTASTSEKSKALATDLKKRGWKFVGPVTVYAFMQAAGLINDHSKGCVIRPEIDRTRTDFGKPE